MEVSQAPEKPAVSTARLGMMLFIVSEAFLFGSLFWTYYYLKIKSPVWPPEGAHVGSALAGVNTVILLTSSLTVWWAVRSIRKGNARMLVLGLTATALLGIAFTGITFYEWTHFEFRPWSHAYGSIVYTMTGFHALHVVMGILLLAVLLIRSVRGKFSSRNHLAVEIGSLYWHFVDLVWIGVFSTIFLIR